MEECQASAISGRFPTNTTHNDLSSNDTPVSFGLLGTVAKLQFVSVITLGVSLESFVTDKDWTRADEGECLSAGSTRLVVVVVVFGGNLLVEVASFVMSFPVFAPLVLPLGLPTFLFSNVPVSLHCLVDGLLSTTIFFFLVLFSSLVPILFCGCALGVSLLLLWPLAALPLLVFPRKKDDEDASLDLPRNKCLGTGDCKMDRSLIRKISSAGLSIYIYFYVCVGCVQSKN